MCSKLYLWFNHMMMLKAFVEMNILLIVALFS